MIERYKIEERKRESYGGTVRQHDGGERLRKSNVLYEWE